MNPHFSESANQPNSSVYRLTVDIYNRDLNAETRHLLRDVIAMNSPRNITQNGNSHSNGNGKHHLPYRYRHRRHKNRTIPHPVAYSGPKRWGNCNRFLEGPQAESTAIVPTSPDQRLELEAAFYARKIIDALLSDLQNEQKCADCIARADALWEHLDQPENTSNIRPGDLPERNPRLDATDPFDWL